MAHQNVPRVPFWHIHASGAVTIIEPEAETELEPQRDLEPEEELEPVAEMTSEMSAPRVHNGRRLLEGHR